MFRAEAQHLTRLGPMMPFEHQFSSCVIRHRLSVSLLQPPYAQICMKRTKASVVANHHTLYQRYVGMKQTRKPIFCGAHLQSLACRGQVEMDTALTRLGGDGQLYNLSGSGRECAMMQGGGRTTPTEEKRCWATSSCSGAISTAYPSLRSLAR